MFIVRKLQSTFALGGLYKICQNWVAANGPQSCMRANQMQVHSPGVYTATSEVAPLHICSLSDWDVVPTTVHSNLGNTRVPPEMSTGVWWLQSGQHPMEIHRQLHKEILGSARHSRNTHAACLVLWTQRPAVGLVLGRGFETSVKF